MIISDGGKGFFVLDGANLKQRQWLKDKLLTEVKLEGDRVYFKPTPSAIDFFEKLSNVEWKVQAKGSATILHDYVFEHKMEPYDHQREILPKIFAKGNFGLLWEVGLGKSKTGLDVYTQYFIDGVVNAVLVVTLKGVHRKWVDVDAPENLSIPYEAAAWPIAPTKQDKLLNHNGTIIATINYDATWRKKGLDFIKKLMTMRKVMLIVDESHEAKGHDAKRTQMLLKYAPLARRRMIMTGTVVPNSPLDLWSQMQILDPAIWGGMNFFAFKKRYAVEQEIPGIFYERTLKNGTVVKKPVKTVVSYKNIEELNQIISPWISRLDKSVLKLPPQLYAPTYFDLSDEQRRVYNEVVTKSMSEYGGKQLTPNASLTLRIRLDQITQGFFKADDGEITRFKENPRMDMLANWAEQIPLNKKGIIFAPFVESINAIEELIKKLYGDTYRIYVGQSEGRKEQTEDHHAESIRLFQNDPSIRWFIGSSAAATGITLTAATHVFYYGNFFKLHQRMQSEGRPHRIGQSEAVTYVDSIANKSQDMKRIMSYKSKLEMSATIQGDELRTWII